MLQPEVGSHPSQPRHSALCLYINDVSFILVGRDDPFVQRIIHHRKLLPQFSNPQGSCITRINIAYIYIYIYIYNYKYLIYIYTYKYKQCINIPTYYQFRLTSKQYDYKSITEIEFNCVAAMQGVHHVLQQLILRVSPLVVALVIAVVVAIVVAAEAEAEETVIVDVVVIIYYYSSNADNNASETT